LAVVCVQLHDRVVNAVAREHGEDMFDGMNLDVPFGQRRGAVCLGDIFHTRLDFRLAVQVHATKAHAVVRGRGQNRHIDAVAAVQADAGKAGGIFESLLIEHARLNKTPGALARLDSDSYWQQYAIYKNNFFGRRL